MSIAAMIDIVAAIATVVATVLAIVAIVWSVQQSRATARSLRETRYSAIQMELLTETLDLLNEGRPQTRPLERWRGIHSRLRVLDAPLERARIVFGVGYTDAEKLDRLGYDAVQLAAADDNFEELPRIGGGRERDTLFDELVAAIAGTARASSRSLERARAHADARRAEEARHMAEVRDANGGRFE